MFIKKTKNVFRGFNVKNMLFSHIFLVFLKIYIMNTLDKIRQKVYFLRIQMTVCSYQTWLKFLKVKL